MKNFFVWVLITFLFSIPAISQNTYKLTGVVSDEHGSPLPGAAVVLNDQEFVAVTGTEGLFIFTELEKGKYTLIVTFLGYSPYKKEVDVKGEDVFIEIHLIPAYRSIDEVFITKSYSEARKIYESRSFDLVGAGSIRSYLSGSLMTTLSRLPGISSMDIGAGQSKPVIRGLGFNRIVITEHGIKHEGQQWGSDHGLEIDQYSVDRVEVIRGPASLIYGSDAIGGVIELRQAAIPKMDSYGGEIDLTANTNNMLFGTSAMFQVRKNAFYLRARVTLLDYADYRVPADSVDIYSYRVPLHKNRLRNTAGNEANFHLSAGYSGQNFSSLIHISELRSKSGFFANAHGLEPRRVDMEMYDRSARDIMKPYHKVKHFKLVNQNAYSFGRARAELDLAWQNNYREEWSEYVNHGYMPAVYPDYLDTPADLEKELIRDIYSGNFRFLLNDHRRYTFSTGLSLDAHNNRIGGRGFIIPAYDQINTGAFIYSRFNVNEKAVLNAGIRYDVGKISINEYFDWFQTERVDAVNEELISEYVRRSSALNRTFQNLSWSAGGVYTDSNFRFRSNFGKSFRMPGAHELAANGVNYHHFRYEIGDPSLSPEISWQVDMGVEGDFNRWSFQVNPFVNYFPNYIYLNPSYRFDYMYGAGNQVFNYSRSRVFRTGGEAYLSYRFMPRLTGGATFEYVYSEQLSGDKEGFTLPFSPPASGLINLRYNAKNLNRLSDPYIELDTRLTSPQNRIVPPEKKTPGYQVVNIMAGTRINLEPVTWQISFQVRNLFNTRYFNHTSYYRLIELPEPGRGFVINIKMSF